MAEGERTWEKKIRLSANCEMNLERLITILCERFKYYPKKLALIDVSMFSEDTQKEILNALGEEYSTDRHCRKDTEKAITFFARSGNRARLEQIGNQCLKNNNLNWAEQAFSAIGKRISPKEYRSTGDRLVATGHINQAIEAYTKSGDKQALQALIDLGDRYIAEGKMYWAECALKSVGKKLTKTQIRHIGHSLLKQGDLLNALDAYKSAGYTAGMLRVANLFSEERDWENAQKAFKMAGRSFPLTSKHYLDIGDSYLKRKEVYKAIDAFKKGQCTDRLLEIARSHTGIDYFDRACSAYRAAGAQIPREQALFVAQNKLEMGHFIDANSAFKIGGDKTMTSFTRQFFQEKEVAGE
jgi:tetratricopeptide (TPR) repeat protein